MIKNVIRVMLTTPLKVFKINSSGKVRFPLRN